MTLQALFASGHAADIVLAVIALEGAFLVARGRPPAEVALALAPGALMMVALRGALVAASWWQIALPLALAFPVHMGDLRRRGLLARGSPRP